MSDDTNSVSSAEAMVQVRFDNAINVSCNLAGCNGRCGICTPRELSPNDVTNLEKIAALRALCGKYRRAIVTARRLLLDFEHTNPKPEYPLAALRALSNALEKTP